MKTIKLMADYGCYPLWDASPGNIGNINPEDLPISTKLKARLRSWSDIYDKTLNMDDPLSSGFESKIDQKKFELMGNDLAFQLQKELGDTYTVVAGFIV